MARCPYLDWKSTHYIGGGQYSCKLSRKDLDEKTEVKNKCKVDRGDEYKACPVYKSR